MIKYKKKCSFQIRDISQSYKIIISCRDKLLRVLKKETSLVQERQTKLSKQKKPKKNKQQSLRKHKTETQKMTTKSNF